MRRTLTKVGLPSTVPPQSRSLRKRNITRSNLRWCQEKRKVGVQLVRELKRSGYSSINRKNSNASRLFSKKPRHNVPKSLSCDGPQTAAARFEKSCASSGILAPLTRYGRSRNIGLKS